MCLHAWAHAAETDRTAACGRAPPCCGQAPSHAETNAIKHDKIAAHELHALKQRHAGKHRLSDVKEIWKQKQRNWMAIHPRAVIRLVNRLIGLAQFLQDELNLTRANPWLTIRGSPSISRPPHHRGSMPSNAPLLSFPNGASNAASFDSSVNSRAAINRFLDETNQDPKPFTWTADPDKIVAAVKRHNDRPDAVALDTIQQRREACPGFDGGNQGNPAVCRW
jgi:hypothetical protein